ncbi:MAG: alpha-D-ribose 1-methylphosphonate 5-triphosphate diphosphatase [Rhodospirillales bacterium]|nr:alpha-D-ribose 1-methylphosphonate 5-triphosphate diphosphatase [Rhodospirillales bacterium]
MILANARVLTPSGLVERNLVVEQGRIAGFTDAPGWDLRGALVLPAIVDIHGDAFERQLQPRPGVEFPVGLALAETERQLLANGIATAFHGVTLSWEPGLRGLEMWRTLLAALAGNRFTCDMRVHLRWEAHNVAALADALDAIRAGQVHLLAYNDHTPSIVRKLDNPAVSAKYAERAGIDADAFRAIALAAAARGPEVVGAWQALAAAAREAGLPIASHDDATVEERARFRAAGAAICEFPMAEAVAVDARAADEAVVMGAPNVVRGRSHLGWASAAAMAQRGLCTVLASDYYYPCLLEAPFRLAARGMPLAEAWALVAANPARASRLEDRGRLVPGLRADLAVVALEQGEPHLLATFVGGVLGWAAPELGAELKPGA